MSGEEYGRYPVPRPVPRTHLELSDEVQVERRSPPIVQAPDGRCRAFTKRRFNEVGELVIRRIRICEEAVRGPAGLVRRTAASRGLWTTGSPMAVPLPPQGSEPEELEKGEPG